GPEAAAAPAGAPPASIDHATLPLSSSEVDYPLVRAIHAASSLATATAVSAWREGAWRETAPPAGAKLVALPPPRERAGRELGETIQRRGSTREFGRAPLTAEELATTLWAATRSVAVDAPGGLVDLYLIVNAVDGVPSGAYFYRPDAHALETLATGEFRNRSAHLCLEQPLGGGGRHLLPRAARCDHAGTRRSRLSAGESRGRTGRRTRLPSRLRAGLRRLRAHVLRRPRRGVLLAARGRQGRDLRDRARPIGRGRAC